MHVREIIREELIQTGCAETLCKDDTGGMQRRGQTYGRSLSPGMGREGQLKKKNRGGKCGSVQSLSRVQLFATPWTAARQAALPITNSQHLLNLMFRESEEGKESAKTSVSSLCVVRS